MTYATKQLLMQIPVCYYKSSYIDECKINAIQNLTGVISFSLLWTAERCKEGDVKV